MMLHFWIMIKMYKVLIIIYVCVYIYIYIFFQVRVFLGTL